MSSKVEDLKATMILLVQSSQATPEEMAQALCAAYEHPVAVGIALDKLTHCIVLASVSVEVFRGRLEHEKIITATDQQIYDAMCEAENIHDDAWDIINAAAAKLAEQGLVRDMTPEEEIEWAKKTY